MAGKRGWVLQKAPTRYPSSICTPSSPRVGGIRPHCPPPHRPVPLPPRIGAQKQSQELDQRRREARGGENPPVVGAERPRQVEREAGREAGRLLLRAPTTPSFDSQSDRGDQEAPQEPPGGRDQQCRLPASGSSGTPARSPPPPPQAPPRGRLKRPRKAVRPGFLLRPSREDTAAAWEGEGCRGPGGGPIGGPATPAPIWRPGAAEKTVGGPVRWGWLPGEQRRRPKAGLGWDGAVGATGGCGTCPPPARSARNAVPLAGEAGASGAAAAGQLDAGL